MREEEQESDRAYSRLQRHQPLSEYKHEERKKEKKKGGGGMGRGERNGLQMLVPSLPLFPHPHARILRETSVPCSFSSTRPPGSTNRRGMPQYYYNRLGKCVHVFFVVVTERLFSLQNKWAEHTRMGETRKARAVMSRPRRRQLLSLARRYLRTSGSGIGHSSLQLLSTTQMPPVRVSV